MLGGKGRVFQKALRRIDGSDGGTQGRPRRSAVCQKEAVQDRQRDVGDSHGIEIGRTGVPVAQCQQPTTVFGRRR